MKTLLILLAVLLYAETTTTEPEIFIRNINVYDSWGTNFVDFRFTYDASNNCRNNFKIYNNMSNHVSFKFSIYMGGDLKYNGWTTIPSGQSVYFNNAFWDCNSSGDSISVYTD